MTLRVQDFARISERLITEFQGQVSLLMVIQILRSCTDDGAQDSPELVERTARRRLRTRPKSITR